LDQQKVLVEHGKDEVKHEVKIVPDLEPESDNKFFKKDYPDDSRPDPINHFSYPYPIVQDSDHYDKDYVQDQNDDGGYWKTQMAYDEVRNKLAKEKRELAKAFAKEREEFAEIEKAKEAERIAEAEAVAAEKEEKKAEAAHSEAHAALEGLKSDIGESADTVDKEITDLEECKKQLEDAKVKLKKELEEKEEREAHQIEREGKERNAEQEHIDAMKTEEQKEKSLGEEEKDVDDAQKLYDKKVAALKAAEAELEAAYQNLRKYRHADPDGGVYEVNHKGGAHQSTALSSLFVGLVMMQLLLSRP